MPIVRFSLTAFLSGFGASLQPTNPGQRARGGSFTPTNPGEGSGGSGLSPTNPGQRARGSSLTPTNPPGGEWSPTNPGEDWSPANPGMDWEGIDPPWVYSGDRALLSQALRKSRAKVLRLSDPVAPGKPPAAKSKGKLPIEDNLWRWAPEFRVTAVAAELMARVHVRDREVLHTAPARTLFAIPSDSALSKVDWPDQRDKVIRAAVEREDRLPEILSQAADLWPFFESVSGVQLARAPAFAELLSAVNEWALHLLMLLKHRVAAWRPVEMSTLVAPVIRTPGHGSMPSGHATMASLTGTMLTLMMYGSGSPHARVLDRLARRIAFNRVVAGVHFPVDNVVGYRLGRHLAYTLHALATGGLLPEPPDASVLLTAPWDLKETDEDTSEPEWIAGGCEPAPALCTLWAEAQKQINRLRV
jgi:hypothetical protein